MVGITPQAGEVATQISFGFPNDTNIVSSNWSSESVRIARSDLDFDRDGLPVTYVRFEVWNSGEAETQDLGVFKFEGEQF